MEFRKSWPNKYLHFLRNQSRFHTYSCIRTRLRNMQFLFTKKEVLLTLESGAIARYQNTIDEVKDTRLEAKAKEQKNPRSKPKTAFRGQTLSRPRTEMLKAKAKDTGGKCSPKKKKTVQFFRRSSKF